MSKSDPKIQAVPSPLVSGARPGSVAPHVLQKKLGAGGSGLDGPLENSRLVVDRNRWMAFAFALLILVIVMFYFYAGAAADARHNTQLMYVKMYRDGTWDTDFFDSKRDVEFLPATVDSLLSNWTTRRYQENAATVGKDYGFVRIFMDAKAAAAFMDPQQGNAVKKAAAIREARGEGKEIEIRNVNHFDSESNLTFGRTKGSLYRTNVFIRELLKSSAGSINSTKLAIVQIQWRLMTKAEIQSRAGQSDGSDWLRANPIGIQIIDYKYVEDPTDDSASKTPTPTTH